MVFNCIFASFALSDGYDFSICGADDDLLQVNYEIIDQIVVISRSSSSSSQEYAAENLCTISSSLSSFSSRTSIPTSFATAARFCCKESVENSGQKSFTINSISPSQQPFISDNPPFGSENDKKENAICLKTYFTHQADRYATYLTNIINGDYNNNNDSNSNSHSSNYGNSGRQEKQPFQTSSIFNMWWPLNNSEIYVSVPRNFARSISSSGATLVVWEKLILELIDPAINLNYLLQVFAHDGIKLLIGVENSSQCEKLYVDNELLNANTNMAVQMEISPKYFAVEGSVIEIAYPLNLTVPYGKCGADRINLIVSLCYSWDRSKCFAVFSTSILIVDVTAPNYALDAARNSNIDFKIHQHHHPFINKIPNRNYLGHSLRFLLPNATSMIEVGVNRGEFSEIMQASWGKFTKYMMVDPWGDYRSLYGNYSPKSSSAMFNKLYFGYNNSTGMNSNQPRWVDMNNIDSYGSDSSSMTGTATTEKGIDGSNSRKRRNSSSSNNKSNNSLNNNMDTYYSRFKDTIDRLASINSSISIIIRATSKDASYLIADNSIDLVYIDARHDYYSVMEDLILWYPKVSCGGILAGHDYALGYSHNTIFTVIPAVDRFALRLGLTVIQTKDDVLPTWILYKTNCLL